MNALTELPEAQLQQIPIEHISVSSTAVQALRRQHYNNTKLLELALSIEQNGVLQPILVRVAPTVDALNR
jgi:ParB-like chromosome segregation protein Spo0J